VKNKKILSFIYTIDEKINLEEITRINFFQKYLEDNSLDNLVQIIIYINNYKITKAFNKKITILENEKNLKKTDFLYENLEKIDSKYFKLIKAKDKIIFN
jgi:Leucine-rich repeat (LRR) protein